MSSPFPRLVLAEPGSSAAPRLGHRLVDAHLELVAARLSANSTLAIASDARAYLCFCKGDHRRSSRRRRFALTVGSTRRRRGTSSRHGQPPKSGFRSLVTLVAEPERRAWWTSSGRTLILARTDIRQAGGATRTLCSSTYDRPPLVTGEAE
jgi:hypothetical protein